MQTSKRLVFLLTASIFTLSAAEAELKLSIDRKDGIYRKGDTVRLGIDYTVDGKPGTGPMRILVLRQDGKQTVFDFPGPQKEFQLKLDSQAVRFTVLADHDPKKSTGTPSGRSAVNASIGVIADPETIRPGFEEPPDFQQFWDNAKAELAKIPVRADRVAVEVPKERQGKFNCWDVKVDCAGGRPVSGYLTMPVDAKPKSLPAIVSFHGAGVYTSWKEFENGAIRFDVNAHGIENGHPKEYYRKLRTGELADYRRRDADDRGKFYFRGMFLRVLRALEYVKTLPEYDGRTLIVRGGSQGGAQTLVAAGLDPDVVLICARVPAMCDHGGILAGRESGWPKLIQLKNGKPVDPAIVRTAAYYDCAFFARRIKAEAFLTVGLIDRTCCPCSVYAAFNSIPGKKHIFVMPDKGHVGITPPEFLKRQQELISGKK